MKKKTFIDAPKLSIHVSEFINATARTELNQGLDAPEVIPDIKVVSFSEESLELEIPSRSCGVGHKLTLEMLVKGGKADETAEIAGSVAERDDSNKKFDTIIVKLNDPCPMDWKLLIQQFKEKQKQVAKLFKTIKGH